MKTIIKRSIAVILALMIASASLVCFAANEEKQYHEYRTSVLLGDSLCSGFRDYEDVDSEFEYVADSYAAYIAADLGVETYYPMACPGFRTIEMRTMLEDDYVSNDPYLFEAVPHHSAEEILAKKEEFRNAIREADLITIQIGGNDWGAYLGWVMEDFLEENPLPEEFETALREYLANANIVEDNMVKILVELAQTFNAVDEFLAIMPKAIEYAFARLTENWPIIVEDIYALNPDVTLVAVGMFNTTLSTPEGEPDNVAEPDELAVMVEQMIIDYGNKPMIENQAKYGYIYVDTTGTIVETAHPTAAGHRHIADRILEALPDARFDLTDVKVSDPEYKAVEYMYVNGFMSAAANNTFNGDAKITKDEYSATLKALGSSLPALGINNRISVLELKFASFLLSKEKSIMDLMTFVYEIGQLFSSGTAFESISRTQVAVALYDAVK